MYPRGSDKYLSHITSSPRICRACRPTTRRHFAHTAIAKLCEMAKRRLLRCSLRTARLGLCRALSALRSCSGTGLRAAARGPRCSTGGGWSAGSAGRSHAPSGDGVPLGRGIEHASNSPRRLRAIEHASRYPPRRDSLRQIRGEEHRCDGTRRRRAPSDGPASRSGYSRGTGAEDTSVSRAGSATGQGNPLRGRPKPADLDRRWRRARMNASAPGEIQPVSHQGKWGRGYAGARVGVHI